jgi:hypothetical protein
MAFIRGKNPKKSLRIGRSVLDELADHPVCCPINDPTKDVTNPRDPNLKVWINPHDQFSFNSDWCTEQDLRDWMDGTGLMVRGKTPEEKQKYWEYAVFEASGGFGSMHWLIKHTWRWFPQFVTDFKPNRVNGYAMDSAIEKPLKVRNTRTRDDLLNRKREEEVIIAMFAPFIEEIVADLEYTELSNLRKRYDDTFYGIKRTLFCMGVGYFGACNTPEDIRNLSWVTDIVWAKALYAHLKNTGETLPDFEWLVGRNHYLD